MEKQEDAPQQIRLAVLGVSSIWAYLHTNVVNLVLSLFLFWFIFFAPLHQVSLKIGGNLGYYTVTVNQMQAN